jgi:hypothetical protein
MKRLAVCLFVLWSVMSCAPSAHLTFPQYPVSQTNDLFWPSARLSFPEHPHSQSSGFLWYDINGTGKPNFAISADGNTLCYTSPDSPNRIYRISDYADADVPHAIILLDSIPYQSMLDWYNAGHLRFFNPPVKVIPPFPSLTEICYSDVLRAPPLPGMIDQSYDARIRQQRSVLWPRLKGYSEPWERRLDYHAAFWEYGLSYLHPRPWLAAELERSRASLDQSPYRVTLVYVGSASPMACKYGQPGVQETLEAADQLCLQLLYERHGAIKISLMADHGHNFMPSKNVPIDKFLEAAGFHARDTLADPDDVVVEENGLVTYAGIQTAQPLRVADALLTHPEIQLVMYMENDRVIVRDVHGKAAIECRDKEVRYIPQGGDLLGLQPVIAELTKSGKADADGYVSDEDWLAATADHQWPDAPRRIWDAFHRMAASTPAVMFTLNDGYCAGLSSFERYIDMASTHGGLNQINSATFVMTMTNAKPTAILRSRDVLNWIEPGFDPLVHER